MKMLLRRIKKNKKFLNKSTQKPLNPKERKRFRLLNLMKLKICLAEQMDKVKKPRQKDWQEEHKRELKWLLGKKCRQRK